MGQATRSLKYNKFWSWMSNTMEDSEDAIDMLLHILTDEQLDQLIDDISNEDQNLSP